MGELLNQSRRPSRNRASATGTAACAVAVFCLSVFLPALLDTASCVQAQTSIESRLTDSLFRSESMWTTELSTPSNADFHSPDEMSSWGDASLADSRVTTASSAAQIEYPVVPPVRELPGEPFLSFAESKDSGYCTPDDAACIPRFRNSFFQGVHVAAGTVGGGRGDDYLNIDHTLVTAGVAIPLGSMDNVLMISPSFRADFLKVAIGTDLPDLLYETGVRFFWKAPIHDRLSSLVIVTPSIRSDFTTTQNAFRVFGMVLLTWQTVPDQLSLSAGFMYLDRTDLPAIPAAGILWTPTPDWQVDIQFPQPKVAFRLNRKPGYSESWVYMVGGFGGNTWGVSRASGAADELTISDLRLAIGYEKVLVENRGWYVEAGWAFNRSVEYASTAIEQEFSDALLLRAGISF